MELPYYATGTSFLTGAAEYHLNKKLRPYRPIRYNNPSLFKPGDVARHLDTGKLMSGSRYLQTARGLLYWTGVGAGLLGVFLSYQAYSRGSGGATRQREVRARFVIFRNGVLRGCRSHVISHLLYCL